MPNFVPVVYSTGTAVMRSDGKTQRVACPPLAQWLTVYDGLHVARGRGHVVYYQTMGGADASAGTHNCGSAWDMKYTGDAAIMDAREMGAADWHRIPGYNGWPYTGANHNHGLIRCGDNNCNGYQYTAWLSGHNGLGLNGVGAGDPLPRPSVIRTWQQGIAWAQAQIVQLSIPMTIASTQEDDMSYVMSTTNGSFYLVTPAGRIGIGSMGQVLDACSALDARATRAYGPSPQGWHVVQGTPCSQAQADLLESLEATVRAQAKAV